MAYTCSSSRSGAAAAAAPSAGGRTSSTSRAPRTTTHPSPLLRPPAALPHRHAQSAAANARAPSRAPFPSARPSISRGAAAPLAVAASAAPAAANPATTPGAGAGVADTSATLLLPADMPPPPNFPACLPARDALPPLPPLDDDYERRVSFSPFANWLAPGALAVGRYPFVEPSRCLSRAQGEAQLAALMAPARRRQGGAAWSSSGSGSGSSGSSDEEESSNSNSNNDGDSDSDNTNGGSNVNNGNPGCGVRTFFSLQSELPPQWSMPVGGSGGGFLPYKAAAELIHAGMAGPPPQEAVDGLRNPSLDRFLPPRRRANTPEYLAFARRESALSFLHCPIEDLGVPQMGQLKAAVAELAGRLAAAEAARREQQRQREAGLAASGRGPGEDDDAAGAVLLHCWGGRGRAGLVGACLLVAAYGLSADEALLRVQRAFDTRRDNDRRSPETDAQHALVRAFEAEVVQGGR